MTPVLSQVKPQANPIPTIQNRVGTPQVHAQSAQAVTQRVAQIQQPITKAAPLTGGTGILAQKGPVTQTYGQQSQYDVFSNGKSPAHEIAVPEGTTLRTPPGTWKVLSTVSDANPKGFIGDKQGQGWGNNVRLQNTQTGDVIGYNHMRNVAVQPGQTLPGGFDVGPSGMSGNATGPHVAFTYADSRGRVGDFQQSPYAQYLFGGVNPTNSAPGMTTQNGINLVGAPTQNQQSMIQFFQPDPAPVQPIQAPDLPEPIVQNTTPQQQNYSQAPGRYSQMPGQPTGQGGGTNQYIINGPTPSQLGVFNAAKSGMQAIGNTFNQAKDSILGPRTLQSPISNQTTFQTTPFSTPMFASGQQVSPDFIKQRYAGLPVAQISPGEMSVLNGKQAVAQPTIPILQNGVQPSSAPKFMPKTGSAVIDPKVKSFLETKVFPTTRPLGIPDAVAAGQFGAEGRFQGLGANRNNHYNINAVDSNVNKANRYATPDQGVKAYADLLTKRYSAALQQKNPDAVIQGIEQLGYAGDPKTYAQRATNGYQTYTDFVKSTPEYRYYAGQ